MSNVLVVDYSLTGHAQSVGKSIAQEGGWQHAAIDLATSRNGGWGRFLAVLDVFLRRKPVIRYSGPDPAGFDAVVLGGPVWASHIASPLHTFAAEHQTELKNVALFCAYGGSGDNKALQELAGFCGKPPVATLSVKDADLASGAYLPSVKQFVQQVASAATSPRA